MRDKEILELLTEALTPFTLATCQNKGAADTWEQLYESCNQTAAAKMTLKHQENQSNPKTLSALQLTAEAETPEINQREKALTDEISKLKNIVKQLRENKTQTGKYTNKEMWCNFHRTTGHNDSDCRRLKKINEGRPDNNSHFNRSDNNTQYNRYIVLPNGKRNFCRFCVPNNVDLRVTLCQHCWKHSDPSKGVSRGECPACEHARKIQDRDRPRTPNPDGTT